jgi:hypothetical protein
MAFMDMMWGFGILGLFFGLVVFAVSIFALVFWILMLVDCVKRKFKDDTEKIIWILVLVFTGIIGALIYYFIVKNKK